MIKCLQIYFQISVVENILENSAKHKASLGSGVYIFRAPPREHIASGGLGGEMVGQNAILVEGLDPSIEEDMFELFFANKKYSGGGEISHIKMYEKSAVIWYTYNAGKNKFYFFKQNYFCFYSSKAVEDICVETKLLLYAD